VGPECVDLPVTDSILTLLVPIDVSRGQPVGQGYVFRKCVDRPPGLLPAQGLEALGFSLKVISMYK
jgi:hypothetical protein